MLTADKARSTSVGKGEMAPRVPHAGRINKQDARSARVNQTRVLSRSRMQNVRVRD